MADKNAENEKPKKFYVDKLFVGGLSYKTTNESLMQYFSQFGPIKQAVVMKDTEKNVSRGFGFCIFKNPDDAVAAMEVKEHIIDDRKVDVRWALPKEMAPPPIVNEQQGKQVFKKIFIGGINQDDFNEYFSKFGAIESCNIVMDQETKKNRGFGFVIFANAETTNLVLQQPYHVLNGKRVEVKRALTQKDQEPAPTYYRDRSGTFPKQAPTYYQRNDYHYQQVDPYYSMSSDPYYSENYSQYNPTSVRYYRMNPNIPPYPPVPVSVNSVGAENDNNYYPSRNSMNTMGTPGLSSSRGNIPNPLDSPGVFPHTMSNPVLPSLTSNTPNISVLESSLADSPSLSYTQRDSFSMLQQSPSYTNSMEPGQDDSYILRSPDDAIYNNPSQFHTRFASHSLSRISPLPPTTSTLSAQEPYLPIQPGHLDNRHRRVESFFSENQTNLDNSFSSDPLFPNEKSSSPTLAFDPSPSPYFAQRQTEPILLSSFQSNVNMPPYEGSTRGPSPLKNTHPYPYSSHNPPGSMAYMSNRHFDNTSADSLFLSSPHINPLNSTSNEGDDISGLSFSNNDSSRNSSPFKIRSYPKSAFQSDPGQASLFAPESNIYASNNYMMNPLANGNSDVSLIFKSEDSFNPLSSKDMTMNSFQNDARSSPLFHSSSTTTMRLPNSTYNNLTAPFHRFPEVETANNYDIPNNDDLGTINDNHSDKYIEIKESENPYILESAEVFTELNSPHESYGVLKHTKHYKHLLFSSQSGDSKHTPSLSD